MNFLFSKNEIERALVALDLGTKTLEILEIGFSGETIHPRMSLRRDHLALLNMLHCNGFHFIVVDIPLLVAKLFAYG
jgi:hypothetical protein